MSDPQDYKVMTATFPSYNSVFVLVLLVTDRNLSASLSWLGLGLGLHPWVVERVICTVS